MTTWKSLSIFNESLNKFMFMSIELFHSIRARSVKVFGKNSSIKGLTYKWAKLNQNKDTRG